MVRRLLVVVAFAVAGGSLAGCSSGKEKKCKEVYATTMKAVADLAKAFGGKDADPMKELSEEKFVSVCKDLPDDAIECADMKFAMANMAKCAQITMKYKDKFEALKGKMR